MSILAVDEFVDTYYQHENPRWTELVGPVVGLLVVISLLVWLFRLLNRAMKQSKACLDQSTTGIDVARESIDVSREAIDLSRQLMELQRESNRLLAQLNETLKNRTLT